MFDYWKKFNCGLWTDLYQLTMAQGYHSNQRHEMWSCFHLFFRRAPFGDRKAVAAGLALALDYLKNIRFEEKHIQFLASILGNDGKPIFEEKFLNALRNFKLEITVDAVPEGTVVFAHEPLFRVSGPLWQCQLVESSLLNIINFHTLIASKASHIVMAAGINSVVSDFGLRRAQGPDGSISASRAAYIAGCVGTSNVAAGYIWDIPVNGTHAHSWVMSFESELEAFMRYAEALPNNGVYLVDTYEPVQGIKNAIKTFKKLEQLGYRGKGIRLDSGDLCELSIIARKMLDEAGLDYIKIFASDSLNEHKIKELRARGAKIDVWGVGTNMITAQDQPALGGVYKLGAILYPTTGLHPCMKFSATPEKATNPGILNTRRIFDSSGRMVADIIYDDTHSLFPEVTPLSKVIDFKDRRLTEEVRGRHVRHKDLLVRVVTRGEIVYPEQNIHELQKRCVNNMRNFLRHEDMLVNAANNTPVHLHRSVEQLKMQLWKERAA